MKDNVGIGNSTKYDALRVHRDQAMNLEILNLNTKTNTK